MSASSAQLGVYEPQARLKTLAKCSVVEIDPNIPIRRYFRSGTEMVRMAQVYLSEGHIENAYILYMKFLLLFLEKIPAHPDYKQSALPAPLKQQKLQIQAKLKEVLPLTERLKAKLLEKYERDYTQFLAKKAEEERESRAARERDRIRTPDSGIASAGSDYPIMPTAPPPPDLDQIVYPADFPSDPSKPKLKAGEKGLILRDTDSRPEFNRSLKPSTSLVEGQLRTVVIPTVTMTKFLELAEPNTRSNVETCGILAGTLTQNRLSITHVIVPKQLGTSDSCTTMNEEELFDYQDQLNLITLGWIHTHPSQTAFLSSVDLHTHCSYQIMMPEAVAIVCAPKYNDTGFFCLTPDYGLDYIAQCTKSGFHPHPAEPALFMSAPHIQLDNSARLEVIDLRRK